MCGYSWHWACVYVALAQIHHESPVYCVSAEMDDRTTLPDFQKRYRALSRLAISAAAGESVDRLLRDAVGEAVSLVGLVAGAVRIFGAGDQDLAGALGGDQAGQARMQELESTLLGQLRRNYAVRSLFMTLDLDGPAGLFS